VHASTRILLVLVAIIAIGVGWWTLLSINDVGTGIVYSALWTVVVLIAARVLLAVGFGFNRLTAGPGPGIERATGGCRGGPRGAHRSS
jgi:hypothetical protein